MGDLTFLIALSLFILFALTVAVVIEKKHIRLLLIPVALLSLQIGANAFDYEWEPVYQDGDYSVEYVAGTFHTDGMVADMNIDVPDTYYIWKGTDRIAAFWTETDAYDYLKYKMQHDETDYYGGWK